MVAGYQGMNAIGNMAILISELIDEYSAALSTAAERDALSSLVQQIQRAPAAANLSTFLSTFAQSVAELYAANAVAIWFSTPTQSNADQNTAQETQPDTNQNNEHDANRNDERSVVRKVDVGWNNLGLDTLTASAHQRLIAYAIGQQQSLVVQPFSAPGLKSGVSNPTDSVLLLAPVRFQNREVAVLEIVLGPKPLRRPHETLLEAYLQWLEWLSDNLQRGIARYFPAENLMELANAQLDRAASDVAAIQLQIRESLEASLSRLTGANFGTLDANQSIAKRIHELLDSKGLRVQCPECGAPAILRCQKAGNSKTGAFMFDHYLDSGRTFHGGSSVVPAIVVVSKPPRRKS